MMLGIDYKQMVHSRKIPYKKKQLRFWTKIRIVIEQSELMTISFKFQEKNLFVIFVFVLLCF